MDERARRSRAAGACRPSRCRPGGRRPPPGRRGRARRRPPARAPAPSRPWSRPSSAQLLAARSSSRRPAGPARGSRGRAARRAASAATATPPTNARPAVARVRPASRRSVVVLPAPLGPSSPNTEPVGTPSSAPSRARRRPDSAWSGRRSRIAGGRGVGIAGRRASRRQPPRGGGGERRRPVRPERRRTAATIGGSCGLPQPGIAPGPGACGSTGPSSRPTRKYRIGPIRLTNTMMTAQTALVAAPDGAGRRGGGRRSRATSSPSWTDHERDQQQDDLRIELLEPEVHARQHRVDDRGAHGARAVGPAAAGPWAPARPTALDSASPVEPLRPASDVTFRRSTMTDDRERWALILGASSGMGQATALALAAGGLPDLRHPPRLPRGPRARRGGQGEDRRRGLRGPVHQHERGRRREARRASSWLPRCGTGRGSRAATTLRSRGRAHPHWFL